MIQNGEGKLENRFMLLCVPSFCVVRRLCCPRLSTSFRH